MTLQHLMKRPCSSTLPRTNTDSFRTLLVYKPMPEPPALLQAINLTLTTIDRRIRIYRVLVVYVIVAGIGFPVASLMTHVWLLSAGLASIIPAVAIYLWVDKRVVRKWADAVTTLSHHEKLDLVQFKQTIISFRHLPASTLKAMLALAPSKTMT